MTTFNEALAEHGSAKEAIRHTLQNVYEDAIGDIYASFGPVAQWVFANAAAIHQHQSESPTEKAEMLHRIGSAIRDSEDRDRVLSIRLQALEDAPGPRPNADEVSALRQRMDALTETLKKMQALDTSDVLTALVRDVALLKDDRVLGYDVSVTLDTARDFSELVFGTDPQTPEARRLLGLDVEPTEAEPEPVYEWVGNNFCSGFDPVGQVMLCYSFEWIGLCDRHPHQSPRFKTKSEACAWVEAQFNNPKNR